MKKYFSMLVVAALGLFTSCSEDALIGEEGGELTTITVTAPQQGLATRAGATAFADPALSNMRVALIISTEDNHVITVTTKTHSFGTGSTPCTFEARLYKGKTYNLSVWADYGATYYTIPTQPTTTAEAEATLPVVKMASTTITGNVNNYDAYFGNETKSLSGNETINIVLSRPFALVKVNTTDWDENAVKLAGYRPDAYATTFKAPTQLNLVSGVADEAADINTSASIVEYDQDGNPKQLHYDYLFANTTANILDPFTVVYSQSGTASSDYTFENIPVQRNYQTNITGNILTKNGKINVTITPNWYQPDTEILLADDNTDVKSALQEKVDDTSKDGKDVGVEVKNYAGEENNEYRIVIPKEMMATNTPAIALSVPEVPEGKTLVITDEVIGTNEYDGEVTVILPETSTTTSKVKLQTSAAHVELVGNYDLITTSTNDQTLVVAQGYTVKNIVVVKGNVAVKGNVNNITRDQSNTDPITYVKLYSTGTWTNKDTQVSSTLVVLGPVAQVNGVEYFTMQEAFTAAEVGGTIKVLQDVTETPAYAYEMLQNGDVTLTADQPVTVTLAPTAKTSKVDNDGMAYFRANNNKSLTIAENVTLKMPATAAATGAMYFGYGDKTAINVVLNGHIEAYLPYVGAMSSLTIAPNASLTSVSECLNVRWGATMNVDGTGAAWSEATPQVKLGYATQQGGIVTFKNTFVNAGAWWNMWNRNSKTDVETKLVLDNTTFAADGFTGSTANVPDYTVVLKNNSKMKINGGFSTIAGGTVNIEAGSTISAKSVSNAGVINIDATDATAEKILVVSCSGTASYGTVNVTGDYKTLVEDNNLYIVPAIFWTDFAANEYASETSNAITITTPQQLALLAKKVNSGTSYNGYTITLDGTFDMSAHWWVPINAWGKFSGATIKGTNSASINNLKIDKAVYSGTYNYYAGFIAQSTGTLTIKDLNFAGAVSVSNGSGIAVVLGLTYGNTTFENVSVQNSQITAVTKAGALLGFTGGDGITVKMKNCSIDNVTVTSSYSYALFAGLININDKIEFEGCTSTNSNAVFDETLGGYTAYKEIQAGGKTYTYGVEEGNLWITGVNNAWAEIRTNPSPTKTIDEVTYTIKGDKVFHENGTTPITIVE